MQDREKEVVFVFCMRLIGNEHDARNIADACGDLELDKAYHKATAMAAALKGKKTVVPTEEQKRIRKWLQAPENLQEFAAIIDDLPPKRRIAFVLRNQCDMSMGSIAEFLDSDHCKVVYDVMEAEKAVHNMIGIDKSTILPKVDGRPFYKALLEVV